MVLLRRVRPGEVSERPKELVLKTSEAKVSLGSNPSLSARVIFIYLG